MCHLLQGREVALLRCCDISTWRRISFYHSTCAKSMDHNTNWCLGASPGLSPWSNHPQWPPTRNSCLLRRAHIFWAFSEGGIFIICSHFGRYWRAIFSLFWAILAVFEGGCLYYFRPFWPIPEGGIFIIFGHFGLFRRAVFLLFSAFLAAFGGRYFYYFWPLWPFSEAVFGNGVRIDGKYIGPSAPTA